MINGLQFSENGSSNFTFPTTCAKKTQLIILFCMEEHGEHAKNINCSFSFFLNTHFILERSNMKSLELSKIIPILGKQF